MDLVLTSASKILTKYIHKKYLPFTVLITSITKIISTVKVATIHFVTNEILVDIIVSPKVKNSDVQVLT